MNKPAFFLCALVLAISALVIHFKARGFLAEASHRKAARISESSQQHKPYVADPLASQASHDRKTLTTIGIVLTALSIVCMLMASLRREPGWYLFLLMLVIFAIMTPMLL